ncbi:hypothetical protein BAL199_23532 [alpha proteobacterium BAL199]|nr:hypothetical protein BAL199_23532 [alpha proteobacterium BAL199]
MMRLLAAITLILLGLTLSAPGIARSGSGTYSVASGSYEARLPAGWDGRTPLPLLVFFHGYRQRG